MMPEPRPEGWGEVLTGATAKGRRGRDRGAEQTHASRVFMRAGLIGLLEARRRRWRCTSALAGRLHRDTFRVDGHKVVRLGLVPGGKGIRAAGGGDVSHSAIW